MSDDQKPDEVPINVPAWVEEAKGNPVLYLQRQATEAVLTAIGLSKKLSHSLVLKGGTLMALAFKSDRATGDVDFSATVPPENLVDDIREELNRELPNSLRQLGYVDLLCRVQRVKKKPRPTHFKDLEFPALDITIGYAKKGSAQEKGFQKGQSTNTISLEISFKDQVYQFQELYLFDAHVCVKSFTINELVAEKLRALVQQKKEFRGRFRRQDIYDIWYLLKYHKYKIEESKVFEILIPKCESRGIELSRSTLDDAEIYERAKADWSTIALEINSLPDFDQCYKLVKDFYRALPWP